MTPSLSNIGRQTQTHPDLCASCMAAVVSNQNDPNLERKSNYDQQKLTSNEGATINNTNLQINDCENVNKTVQ